MKWIKAPKEKEKQLSEQVKQQVSEIIQKITDDGDEGLKAYNFQFDKLERDSYLVSQAEIDQAYQEVDDDLIDSIKVAMENITKFAELQLDALHEVEPTQIRPGVYVGSQQVPVDSALCYIPGGNHPLFSTAMMLSIPAKVAGVERIIACSPPMKGTNQIHPATLVALDMCGVKEIAVMGGAQAIAGFAYGTETIDPVSLIVGPGNQYVTEAKRQSYGQVGIDFVAGPSEILTIADETAHAEVVAADLLGQAEHDVNAISTLITTSKELADSVTQAIERQLADLPTKDIAQVSWVNNGSIIYVETLDQAIDLANEMAPEHLQVVVNQEINYRDFRNYGSLFIGPYTAEVFGDYSSGTNHTLPTAKAARYTGGVSVGTFLKTVTQQRIEQDGFDNLKEATKTLANNEGLAAHKEAIKKREEYL